MSSAHMSSSFDYIYFCIYDIDKFVWKSLNQSATWLKWPISDNLANISFHMKWSIGFSVVL